jgi:hypothetical protein
VSGSYKSCVALLILTSNHPKGPGIAGIGLSAAFWYDFSIWIMVENSDVRTRTLCRYVS